MQPTSRHTLALSSSCSARKHNVQCQKCSLPIYFEVMKWTKVVTTTLYMYFQRFYCKYIEKSWNEENYYDYSIYVHRYKLPIYFEVIKWRKVRINLPLFSTVLPSNSRLFLSGRHFVLITTFSTGLVGVEVTSVSCLGQAYRTESTYY